MRTIVHMSDIHFGRTDPTVVKPLIVFVNERKPDLVAVSGDLTQRARSWQFKEARAFLDSLPQPQIVVPGNHDIPLHNVFSRFLSPLEKFRRYITDDLNPFYLDEEMMVVGVNTARSLTFKGGRINELQVNWVRDKICELSDDTVKVVVSHHPFDLPEGRHESHLVGRAHMAMKTLAGCGADLFLAGHLHVSHTGHTATRYKIKGHSALVVQAGTATSTRSRGEANSFNVIHLQHPRISVERIVWEPDTVGFVSTSTEHFRHTVDGWVGA
ncbi:MAG: metallophosphoesterase family protein [Pyrinomonadaceae bacterium]